MKYYRKMTIWENRNRLKTLIKFRKLVVDYFSDVRMEHRSPQSELQKALRVVGGRDIIESNYIKGHIASEVRAEINLMLSKITDTMYSAGIKPTLYYSPPPAIGGLAGKIDLVTNIFNLHLFQIPPDHLLDVIERAIGVYEGDKTRARIRTFSPFFWIGVLLDYIASLPFRLLGNLGFNQSNAENSFWGKFIKVIIRLMGWAIVAITLINHILGIAEKLGYLEKLKKIFNQFARLNS